MDGLIYALSYLKPGALHNLFFVLVVALTPCVPAAVDAAELFFPTQQPSGAGLESLTAQLFGQLVMEDECLRVISDEGQESYLVVWPAGYTYIQDEGIHIINSAGEVVLSVGDEVYLSGGELKEGIDQINAMIEPRLPDERCPGPYWMTGEEVSRR